MQTMQEALDSLIKMGLIEVYTDDRTRQKMVRLVLDSGEVITCPPEDVVSIER